MNHRMAVLAPGTPSTGLRLPALIAEARDCGQHPQPRHARRVRALLPLSHSEERSI